jgi:hypothetical protein
VSATGRDLLLITQPMITMTKHHIAFATLAGFALGVSYPPAVAAQRPDRSPGMVAVRVVVPARGGSSREQDILVTRRATDGGYVIVLPRDAATPENLFAGALVVTGLLERHGDARRDEAVFRVPKSRAAPKRYIAVGNEVLARLNASTPTTVNRVGLARSTYIYMPGAARRSAAIAAGTRRSVLLSTR